MNVKDLAAPLTTDQVEFRVQSINNGGYATILVYKDARVDQQRLDDVVGPLGWSRRHTGNNHNCIVSVWCSEKKEWVSKEDTGTKSNTEAEKGLASDSFKRACFNWGIGRELYDYPKISVKLNQNEWKKDPKPKATWDLQIKEWKWYSEFTDNKLSFLAAQDNHKKIRFTWGERKAK